MNSKNFANPPITNPNNKKKSNINNTKTNSSINILTLKPVFISLIVLCIISFTKASVGGAAEPAVVEDWEVKNYNKTGNCESITSPHSKEECFSQTNETHSCCMVKLNGTYEDPTIIDLYPAPVPHRRLRLLGGAAAAAPAADPHATPAPDPHATPAADGHEVVSEYQFQKCIAIYKGEKSVTSIVRKYKYEGHEINSKFYCNTTQKIMPCGMADPGKFQDCESHSSKAKMCCIINYLKIQTCGLDLKLEHDNENHLGVNFQCTGASSHLRFNFSLVFLAFLALGIGVFF